MKIGLLDKMTKPHSKKFDAPGKPTKPSARKQLKQAARKIKNKDVRQRAVNRLKNGRKK
jgi:hypothetical protein